MLLNLFLLLFGTILGSFWAIVILGVIFLANLQIDYFTPPVGMNLFIASAARGGLRFRSRRSIDPTRRMGKCNTDPDGDREVERHPWDFLAPYPPVEIDDTLPRGIQQPLAQGQIFRPGA